MLRAKLNKMTKKEMVELVIGYDNYIKSFDEDFQCLDRTPVCVSEFLDNDFSNCNLEIGDYVVITYTEDNDLNNWLEEQEEQGTTKYKVVDIDYESGTFWVENCDYGIWFTDEYDIIKGDEE